MSEKEVAMVAIDTQIAESSVADDTDRPLEEDTKKFYKRLIRELREKWKNG